MEFIVIKRVLFFFILITSHLSGLKAIGHSLSHDSSFDRSLCKSWQCDWFEMVRYIIVSSANSLMLLFLVSGFSFIYMRKRHGPNTDP